MKILRKFRPFYVVSGIMLTVLLCAAAFAQPGGLKGRVRTNSGQPIASATVTVTQNGGDVKSAKTASDGTFQLSGIEAGAYGLRVEATGYASGALFNVEVKRNKVRDLGDRLFLTVDQGTQVIIRGSVFFKEGTSVTGAKLELERVGADGSVKSLSTSYSSVSGEFTFRQPGGAAKYRVTAKYNGVAGSKEIEVENAAVYRMAITLDLSSKDR